MIAALKSELRKILTIRSTWIIFLIALGFATALVGFWVYGYKDEGHAAVNAKAMLDSMLTSTAIGGLVLSFIVLLLVGHEYRYNTIMYSLTSSNSRSKVFFAKFFAGLAVVLLFGAIIVALNAALFSLGQHMHHTATMAQQVPFLEVLWRAAGAFAGYAAFAFVLGMLLRNQIASIVVMLMLPAMIENLLGLLLKDNVKYLPFTALGKVSMVTTQKPSTSLAIVGGYVLVLGIVSWVLFVRRDAN